MTDPKPAQCVCGHTPKDHNGDLECLARTDPYGEYCPCNLFEPPNAPQPAQAVERMTDEQLLRAGPPSIEAGSPLDIFRMEAFRARAREAELERELAALRARVDRMSVGMHNAVGRFGRPEGHMECVRHSVPCCPSCLAYALGDIRAALSAAVTCRLCGAEVGPDIMGLPMCYGCGPAKMRPSKP